MRVESEHYNGDIVYVQVKPLQVNQCHHVNNEHKYLVLIEWVPKAQKAVPHSKFEFPCYSNCGSTEEEGSYTEMKSYMSPSLVTSCDMKCIKNYYQQIII